MSPKVNRSALKSVKAFKGPGDSDTKHGVIIIIDEKLWNSQGCSIDSIAGNLHSTNAFKEALCSRMVTLLFTPH
jgi:hypothetical protein